MKTKILTSIKNQDEAKLIKGMPIDIIDVKNVEDGALGFVGCKSAENICKILDNNTLSITMGNHIDPSNNKCTANSIYVDKIGYKYLKFGLFKKEAIKYHEKFLKKINLEQAIPVCVLFADRSFDLSYLKKIINIGYKTIMIDTCFKKNKTTNILDQNTLKQFINLCRLNNIMCGLSGSIEVGDIPFLVNLHPDFLGLRGALCLPKENRKNIEKKQVTKVLDRFHCALNRSSNGLTLSNVSLYSSSTSES